MTRAALTPEPAAESRPTKAVARRAGASTAEPGRRSSKRDSGKEGRKAKIIDATHVLLRQADIASISVKMIAKEAGVSPATVYNLFHTKAAILERVYQKDLLDFGSRMAALQSESHLSRITDCVGVIARHYNSDPRFYRSLVNMPRSEPEDVGLIQAVNRSRANFWADLVRRAIEARELRSDADAAGLGSMMHHAYVGAIAGWAASQISIERCERELTYGFVALLLSYATERGRPELLRKLTALSHHEPSEA
jgi:AcrR family transcriptional regulator